MNNTTIDARTTALKKVAQAITAGQGDIVAKIVQTLVREGCIVDNLYPPMFIPSINDPSIHVSDTNPQVRYFLYRFQTNLGGTAYSIDLNTLVGTEHGTPGYVPTYISLLATKVFKINEKELEFYGNYLDEVISAHVERFGDVVDFAFFNQLKQIAFTRDVDSLGDIAPTQYLNAKYYNTIYGTDITTIGDFSIPEDNIAGGVVGAKRLLTDAWAKFVSLRVVGARVILPIVAYTKIHAWPFTALGLETGRVFFQGLEAAYGGSMFQSLQIVPISKIVDLGAIANEVQGPVNVNVLGLAREKDLDSTKDGNNEVSGKYIAYIVPTASFFGINVIVGGIKTDIVKQLIDGGFPTYNLMSSVYRGLSIGASRAYIAFPAY